MRTFVQTGQDDQVARTLAGLERAVRGVPVAEGRALPRAGGVEIGEHVQRVLLEERRRVAVDDAFPAERDAVGVPGQEDAAADPLELVVLDARAAEQRRATLQMQMRVRVNLEGARDVNTRRDEQPPAARLPAGPRRGGEGGGVERVPVARRAELPNVEGFHGVSVVVTEAISLVPKLHLGTHLSGEVALRSGGK